MLFSAFVYVFVFIPVVLVIMTNVSVSLGRVLDVIVTCSVMTPSSNDVSIALQTQQQLQSCTVSEY